MISPGCNTKKKKNQKLHFRRDYVQVHGGSVITIYARLTTYTSELFLWISDISWQKINKKNGWCIRSSITVYIYSKISYSHARKHQNNSSLKSYGCQKHVLQGVSWEVWEVFMGTMRGALGKLSLVRDMKCDRKVGQRISIPCVHSLPQHSGRTTLHVPLLAWGCHTFPAYSHSSWAAKANPIKHATPR